MRIRDLGPCRLTRRRAAVAVLLALLTSILGPFSSSAQATPASPASTTNLALASGGLRTGVALDGGGLAFTVFESGQGPSDLNGDGDTGDAVLHVWDWTTGTTNLGVASSGSGFSGLKSGRLAFMVRESEQGATDLNGDGDAADSVVHVWDSTAGITNLGLASDVNTRLVSLVGGGLMVTVFESAQGAANLNGDGDALDPVVHVWDPLAGTTNLAVASTPGVSLDGGGFTFGVLEALQGNSDLNGDGDTSDSVAHVRDPAGNIANLGLATRGSGTSLDGGSVALRVAEQDQGNVDLNGDGDTADFSVLHVWDATGGTTNLGVDGLGLPLRGGGLAVGVDEPSEGKRDLNGDGDTADFEVWHVWDRVGGTTNLGLSGVGSSVRLEGGGFAFDVWEPRQGNVDLNGDGDAFDTVAHVWDPTSGTTSLAIAERQLAALDGGGLVLEVPEAGQGNVDLNGDGDAFDTVAHVWDPASGATNLAISTSTSTLGVVPVDGGGLVISVDESSEASSDLNGDGDATDSVMHVWDPAAGTTNLTIAGFLPVPLDGGGFAFVAYEAGQGNSDLNGDGDTLDLVAHVWDPAGRSPEVCDGLDNDGDGTVDDGVTATFYRDADGDDHGDASAPTEACSAPGGYVSVTGDADDSDDSVYPGAPELCDAKDNDQDDATDEGWPDADTDGQADCTDDDDDDDGIIDAQDPDRVAALVADTDTSISKGNRKAFLDRLGYVEARVAAGDSRTAISELKNLRLRVDGCGSKADKNDWVTDCSDQHPIRALIDTLITNLS